MASNINDFFRGWFIGNFEPALLRTDQFEIAYQQNKKDDKVERHYQRIATEYNLITKGSLIANGVTYHTGDLFVFEPYVVAEVEFLEDTDVVVVKTPSVGPEDKVTIDDNI